MDDTAHDTPVVPRDDPADAADLGDAHDAVGPLRQRPTWLVPTRVGALAGYATALGMAGAISSATCSVISANPFL